MSKNTFYISCPIDTYSGYGARSRDFVKSLIELDRYDVKVIPQRWGSTPFGFIENHNEEWGFLSKHLVTGQLTEQPDIWCQITVPNEFQTIGKYNIGLTAGIETTACAPQWLEGCNRMNIVLVSSEHSKKVFEETRFNVQDPQTGRQGEIKLTTPIEVLIEGANLDTYKPLKIEEITERNLLTDINSIKESFAFLFVGHWMQGDIGEDRKNVGLLIKAFYELFKNKKNAPALILKTSMVGSSYMDRREIQKRIDSIRKSVPSKNLPNIYLLCGEFTDTEMNELYNHPKVKAMVSLTKGEGFGRPLLEFSLTNKPVITSNWSGHLDFLNPEFTALIDGQVKLIHPSAQVKDMLIEGSHWFAPDFGSIGYNMNKVFENYKDWTVNGKRQGYHSRTNFSFEKMKEQLDGILSKNVPEIAKKVELKLPQLKKIELPKLKKIEQNG
jgi:glycosyltransferase involved in cell wall biosynthesis